MAVVALANGAAVPREIQTNLALASEWVEALILH